MTDLVSRLLNESPKGEKPEAKPEAKTKPEGKLPPWLKKKGVKAKAPVKESFAARALGESCCDQCGCDSGKCKCEGLADGAEGAEGAETSGAPEETREVQLANDMLAAVESLKKSIEIDWDAEDEEDEDAVEVKAAIEKIEAGARELITMHGEGEEGIGEEGEDEGTRDLEAEVGDEKFTRQREDAAEADAEDDEDEGKAK